MTHFHLDRTAVCCGCDALYPIEVRVCPSCTSQEFMPLGAWLNRIREEVEA